MQVLVVADDLTGANDTSAAFAERGFRTTVHHTTDEIDWSTAVEAGIVDTDSW
jgi:uncharacterized protein YgbK (DUF1537 family)